MVTQATTQATATTLPPTARDFEAYRLVKVERQSTRAVAKLLQLSQTRVCQVIARVAEYLVETTQSEDDARREQQLAVARQVASEHIDDCIKRALRSYEDSCSEVKIVRDVEDPSGRVTRTSTNRKSFGETRYLTAVARLAVIKSKLPTCTLPIAVRRTLDEIAADVQQSADDLEAVETTETESPPSLEACSPKASEQPLPPPSAAELEFVRLEMIKLYNDDMRAMNRPELQLSETVHSVPCREYPVPRPVDSAVACEKRRPTELERKRLRRDRRKQRSATMA